jgi:predicted methyltransferase
MKNRIQSTGLSLLSLLIVSTGCQTGDPQPDGGSASAPARQSAEESVKPGINESFLQEEIEVDTWVERFEREGRDVYDHRHQIMAAVDAPEGSAVADIGAGTGLFVPLLADQVGPEGKVYAVDIVPEFLEYIEQRAAERRLIQVKTVECTERSVNLPAGSIDLAFMCDVYHHFEYPESSLASLHAALRPGGELVLVEFKRVPGESSDWVMDHVRAGPEEFIQEIETAGFEKVEEYDILEENFMVRFRKRPE